MHDSGPVRSIRQSPAAITPREREVISLAYLSNRDIGGLLGISEQLHRAAKHREAAPEAPKTHRTLFTWIWISATVGFACGAVTMGLLWWRSL